MGLLSIFKRQAEPSRGAAASVVDSPDAVQQARTRARQRLIGAIVLLGIGIIGFPLVFETQPRPIPVSIPIETPPKDGAPALSMPAARAPSVKPAEAPPPAVTIAEAREEAASTPAPVASKPAATATAKPAPVEAKVAEVKPAEPKPTESARAKALLEGKTEKVAKSEKTEKAEKASDTGRFVVQVGAFADAGAARETRLKVEKLGLKTYTQVAATSSGNRIRVRAGPYSSRAEADKAQAKAKAAGLTAVVLTL